MFTLVAFADKHKPDCVGNNTLDNLVSIKEIYPWILTTVRDKRHNELRKQLNKKDTKEDPNLKGEVFP